MSPLSLATYGSPTNEDFELFVRGLENRIGGRIGAYALDVSADRSFAYRAEEAFAMCSTFKWLLVAQFLAAVDRGQLRLDGPVLIHQSDILEHAPVVSARLSRGSITLGELAEAAITVGDNSAANLLMRELGGPTALTAFARKLGDDTTRLDRTEPALNENTPGDLRDTTTPRGMVACMQAALTGKTLSPSSRHLLIKWLRASKTGRDRLRAGIPDSWKAGDKTGAGAHCAFNDVAIAFPHRGGPLLMAVYMSECTEPLAMLNDAHRSIASFIVGTMQ